MVMIFGDFEKKCSELNGHATSAYLFQGTTGSLLWSLVAVGTMDHGETQLLSHFIIKMIKILIKRNLPIDFMTCFMLILFGMKNFDFLGPKWCWKCRRMHGEMCIQLPRTSHDVYYAYDVIALFYNNTMNFAFFHVLLRNFEDSHYVGRTGNIIGCQKYTYFFSKCKILWNIS